MNPELFWTQDEPIQVATFSVVCPLCKNKLRYVSRLLAYCNEKQDPGELSAVLNNIWRKHISLCEEKV